MPSETATSNDGMQDAANRVESILFGKDEGETGENKPVEKAVEKDEKKPEEVSALPDEDDANLEEEGDPDEKDEKDEKDELDEIAKDEELSMAAYLGIDEDRLLVAEDGSIAFNAIIDGETKVVPLKELASSYQLQGHVNNKSIALEEERKEFSEQRDAVTNELQLRADSLTELTKLVEDELIGEYNNVDWDKLRRSNPSEWSAKRQEFSERAGKLKRTKALVLEENDKATKQKYEEFKSHLAKNMAIENAKVIAANPTWADNKVLEKAQGELRSFLNNTYGYNDKDFASVSDSRLIALIQDAKKYREGKQGVANKKVVKLPKFRKPGQRRAASSDLATVRKAKGLRAAVKKSGGKTQDVANLLLDRM